MPQRNAKETPASQRANEALDRVTGGDKTPVKKALAFLLEGSHDPAQSQSEPSPGVAQPEPNPIPDQTETKPSPVAPERDFNKRANSLERSALPSGLFPGASKKIYDALYLRTRGALVPARTVQARHRELMAWSGVRDIKTVKLHLNKLRSQGLVAWHTLTGEHEGSFYEVFLPEEVNLDLAQSQPNPSPDQKMGWDPAQKTVWAGLGNPVENKDTYANPKTFIKTIEKTDDDEAFAAHVALLKQATREVTGKGPSSAEAERWREVAEVLVTELKIAAGRTSVSSVPAFLAEHLRRRLWKKEKRQIEAEAADASAASPAPKPDASRCPDCFGTGMFYPEGFDKGVARCRHERLTTEEPERNG